LGRFDKRLVLPWYEVLEREAAPRREELLAPMKVKRRALQQHDDGFGRRHAGRERQLALERGRGGKHHQRVLVSRVDVERDAFGAASLALTVSPDRGHPLSHLWSLA